jgi:hypothetical protein
MDRISTWLDRRPAGQRRALFATVVALLSVGALAVGHAQTPAAPAPCPPAGTGQATRPPSAAPAPTTTTAAPAAPAALAGPLTDLQLTRAADTARRVAAGYATYRFDDPPDAAARRLAGLTTDELAAQLGRAASGGAAGRAAQTRRRETATARVTGVQLRLVATDSAVVVVNLRQEFTTLEGRTAQPRSYAVTVVADGARWVANDIADADAGDLGG